MGKETGISWTHHTFNPWWGCVRVSAGCQACYAQAFDKRVGGANWGVNAPRRFFGEKYWQEPLKWNRAAEKEGQRKRVFCASMADVFEILPSGHPDIKRMAEAREKLWDTIQQTPWLDWQLLTKRPENIAGMLPADWGAGYENVWLGTTIENQYAADKRIPILLQVPAAVRFLSIEPMLSAVDLSQWLKPERDMDGAYWNLSNNAYHYGDPDYSLWAIYGCESGPHRRPCELDWIRDGVAQCRTAGVAPFVKQVKINGKVSKDMSEWPADLQVQEFPAQSEVKR